MPITVLAVDDQRIFRRTLASLIAATPEFEQVGEAASGAEALALAARLRPALVLLDVRMPEMDGIETARRLAAADPDVAIVLISIDELSAPAAEAAPPGTTFVRKQSLSARRLHELWTTLSTAR
jgi:DNA-binding NarL/FixJ family response regulator